jgi:hypothetical protein
MTYEEFLNTSTSFKKDISQVVEIKIRHGLEFTENEKKINQYILRYDEESKLSSLRGHFEKCLRIK